MEPVEKPRSLSPASPRVDDVSKKRKLSPEPSQTSEASRSPKRSRPDGHARSPTYDAAPPGNGAPRSPPSSTTGPDRARPSREESLQEEKKRGKRLFGGILGTLSRSAPSTHQKRRQDIERRQQERAHQQRADDDKLRGENLAKLKKIRQVEQIKFDEQVMRTRHNDLLAKAHFLRTKSEPSVYYLPWRPTEAQEEAIAKQTRDIEELIQREQDVFTRRREQRLKDLGVWRKSAAQEIGPRHKDNDDENEEQELLSGTKDSGDTKFRPREESATEPVAVPDSGHEAEEAETGEVMVENDEDMVIY
ncbi:pinin/SDK/memA/ protein conserved region-domain-containing protein [Microdochium trichocladiopsis]|uniref:Pinin/SDK/memA/ protein conserved region-domain-containing protein n=1 Tax=Microdochium trichocladiopsis TaxID=1682393 RepID=A0A9P8YFE9_9PEZI|nr:pinin/SDK/memA/ protein conserved region-domain-containing protein [Microdochium trichocladiopsis]KAH7037907.1 pinin/SDK/memA/ protein conserved region-domain-containing protein [Microdochium trichocladiopsis]